jgi:nitrogen-specific signal transduction histidine kinase
VSGAAPAGGREREKKKLTELQSRGEFLAVMSHEIRTPLNAVMGYIELLETALAGPLTDMQRDYLERMRASTDHLTGLVGELLDFGRLEAGKLQVEHQRAYASDAIAGALAVVRPGASARGITITERCADQEHLSYEGDEARFRQVLVNLLGNAVKFTPPGGTVQLGCERRSAERDGAALPSGGEWLCVTVKDSGPGIREEQLASIFEPFIQGDRGYSRPADGAGLGLTIARRLTRLMGGDITVRSTPPQGSAFTVWMPVPLDLRSLRSREGARGAGATGAGEVVPKGCAALGERLGAMVDALVDELVEALRREPGVTTLGLLSDAQLEDHLPALLAGIGQSLVILAETPGDPSLSIRDGTEIQRLVADRHGAQRYRIGWAEEMVHREYDLLRQLVARNVSSAPGVTPASLRALNEFFDYAERTSIKGHRLAREAMERG